jgi:hypothetical protein
MQARSHRSVSDNRTLRGGAMGTGGRSWYTVNPNGRCGMNEG